MTVRASGNPRPGSRAAVIVALAAAVALTTVLGATPGAPTGAALAAQAAPVGSRTTDRAISVYQAAIFTTSNTERQAHDRRTFRHQDCVQHYAVRQARRMASQERMFHQDLRPVLRDCHLRKAGENVAYGFLTGASVVVDGWMKSPDHRRNLLDPDFRLLGSGARLGADGLWYAVQVFGRHR